MKTKLNRLLLPAAIIVLAVIVLSLALAGYSKGSTIRIGFVMTGSADDIGWNGMHYTGVLSACEQFDAKLLIKEDVLEGTGECAKAIKELADDGADMIILSSYGYPVEAADTIALYPEISFYAISSDITSENMTSFFGRMYQARYLAGIVAGMQSETGAVGYVAAMPNNEVIRGINAFALGVKSVSPDAKINVVWTDSWDDAEAERAAVRLLIDKTDTDVITYHQNQHNVAQAADEAGVYSIGYNTVAQGLSDKYLTAAVWNWESVYYEIIREFIQGRANSVRRHWFSIDRGVVVLSEYSPLVDEQTRLAVEQAKADILAGQDVFSGEIYDNNGTLRCGEGETMSDEMLFSSFDWFVDGVVIYE